VRVNDNCRVNCVRWSPDGKFLASGSDDQTVILYVQEAGNTRKVFGETFVNKENWVAKSVAKKHASGFLLL
jgi:protein HIRA/HIR1